MIHMETRCHRCHYTIIYGYFTYRRPVLSVGSLDTGLRRKKGRLTHPA